MVFIPMSIRPVTAISKRHATLVPHRAVAIDSNAVSLNSGEKTGIKSGS